MGNYFPQVTVLRGIAILAVLSIHVSPFCRALDPAGAFGRTIPLYTSIDAISQFAVPLFVFISGFVLYNKYRSDYSVAAFYKRRIAATLPPYLCLSTFSIVLLYFGIFSSRRQGLDITDVALKYLTGTSLGPLWFFILIFQIYLLYPLIEHVFSRKLAGNRTFPVLIALFALSPVSYDFLKSVMVTGNLSLFYVTPVLPYLVYLVLGMYACSRFDRVQHLFQGRGVYWCFLPLFFCLFFEVAYTYAKFGDIPAISPSFTLELLNRTAYTALNIIMIAISVFFAGSLFRESRYIRAGLSKIGMYSFSIYLTHYYILLVLFAVLQGAGFTSYYVVLFPAMIVAVVLLSLLVDRTLRRLPYHRFIIGDLK